MSVVQRFHLPKTAGPRGTVDFFSTTSSFCFASTSSSRSFGLGAILRFGRLALIWRWGVVGVLVGHRQSAFGHARAERALGSRSVRTLKCIVALGATVGYVDVSEVVQDPYRSYAPDDRSIPMVGRRVTHW